MTATSYKLLPVCVDGKYGYINPAGDIVVPCRYDYASKFVEGFAHVRTHHNSEDVENQEYIFINEEIREIGRLTFDYCDDFSEGLLAFKQGDNWGYIDTALRVVIRPSFRIARSFEDGLTTVENELDNWGMIDRSGRWVIPPEYQYLWSFRKGESITAFSRGGKRWGLLNRQGRVVVDPRFKSLGWPSKGMLAAEVVIGDEHKQRVIDEEGEWLIQPQFEDSDRGFTDDHMSASVEGKWGLVNREGHWVIEPRYTNARAFSEGLCGVYVGGGRNLDYGLLDGKYGFINKAGEMVIEPRFDNVSEFKEGVAEVKLLDGDMDDFLGRRGYIDTQGRYIWEPTK